MKKILQKIGDFFARLFGSVKKFDAWLKEHVPDVITLVNNILLGVNNPLAGAAIDIVLNLFPEKFRNASKEVQDQAIKLLADAARVLNIGNDCLNKPTDIEVILCFMEALKKRSPVDQQQTATNLGSLFLQQQNPNMKKSQTDSALQMYFMDKKIDSMAA